MINYHFDSNRQNHTMKNWIKAIVIALAGFAYIIISVKGFWDEGGWCFYVAIGVQMIVVLVFLSWCIKLSFDERDEKKRTEQSPHKP